MSLLLPDGIDHLGDAPYTLHSAITHALRILGYEEFPIGERPPRRIWMDPPRLDEHWAEVERKREEKHKPDDKPDEIDGPVEDNAVELLTRG